LISFPLVAEKCERSVFFLSLFQENPQTTGKLFFFPQGQAVKSLFFPPFPNRRESWMSLSLALFSKIELTFFLLSSDNSRAVNPFFSFFFSFFCLHVKNRTTPPLIFSFPGLTFSLRFLFFWLFFPFAAKKVYGAIFLFFSVQFGVTFFFSSLPCVVDFFPFGEPLFLIAG